MENLLIGAGGGGGGGIGKGSGTKSSGSSSPTEAKDNLNSTQYAEVIDLISEGEISGLKNGEKSIYLDNTPLQNADGSYNFQNVTVYTRNGTQNQTSIPIATDVENEKTVSVSVTKATPVVRTISDTNINAVRVTLGFPALQVFSSSGSISGSSVQLQIAVQYNGGGYTTVIDDTVTGRSADLYQRDYLVNLNGAFPVNIKVTRVTADSTSTKIVNAFNWISYTELIYAKLKYPNSALVGLRIDAEQFSSIPQRSYLVRGIKVAIPSNATVDSTTGRLIYNGIWNGSFGAAQWCSDPAWILWDLLTSKRYGFGDHITASQLDKWAFYAASQYASTLVSDGFGGSEPRFSCNINIQTQEEAYKLINDLCSTFRAMPYWSTGALTISQDKPVDPSYLFTLANVSEGGFSYSGGSLKGRPTVAVVSYMDLKERNIAYEVVEDQAAIAKYGVITAEISAFACTSRGQAYRIGKWLLYSSQYETEVVSFTASIDAGVVVRPGQVIKIADPMRAGSRRGGRIKAVTTGGGGAYATAITVDDPTGLPGSGDVSIIMPDGTVATKFATVSGNVITLSSVIAVPNVNSVWVFESAGLTTLLWRVISVAEKDQAQYAITALEYNDSKYNFVESNYELQFRDVTNLNVKPDAPANLGGIETLYDANGKAAAKITVGWLPMVGINEYLVKWRPVDGNWTTQVVQKLDYEILDTTAGGYNIEVYSRSPSGLLSAEPAKLFFLAKGKTAPPADLTNVYANILNPQTVALNWDPHPDIDVKLGGKIWIRHTPNTVGATWGGATTVVPAVNGNQTNKQVPYMAGTYLLRAEDDTGNLSTNAAAVVVDQSLQIQPTFVVTTATSPASNPSLTFAEDLTTPPFQGNLTNMYYDAVLDGLVLAYGTQINDMATDGNWDGLITIDGYGGAVSNGEYGFASTLDLGAIYEVNLKKRMVARAFNPSNLWDTIVLVDDLEKIDDVSGLPDAQLYFRYGPNTSSYSNWIPFQNNYVQGRAFQFKVAATSGNGNENIVIEELGASVVLPQVVQTAGPITSGASTYTVTFAKPFFGAPQVATTAVDMVSGDYATLTNVTRTGFQITFKNSGGTTVSRQFHYTATGYGKEV